MYALFMQDLQLLNYGHLLTMFALEMCCRWLLKCQRCDNTISTDERWKVKKRRSFQRAFCSADILISLSFQTCNDLPLLLIHCTAGAGHTRLIPDPEKICVYIKHRIMTLSSSIGMISRSLVMAKKKSRPQLFTQKHVPLFYRAETYVWGLCNVNAIANANLKIFKLLTM